MEVQFLSSVDNITNPSGNLVGVHLTNFFVLVKLEIGAIVNVFASLLAVAQCHYVFKVLQEAEFVSAVVFSEVLKIVKRIQIVIIY